MPFTVQQLIEGHQETVKVTQHEKAQRALELMIEHDFNQLPVVDDNDKPLGIVTSDSILRALNNFGISLTELQVSHAIVKVDLYNKDFIRAAFDVTNDSDQKTLTAAIAEITNTGISKKFQSALNQYLNQRDNGHTGIDKDLSAKVFANHFTSKEPVKSFDDLTLNEYIQLLLHKSKWSSFSSVFSLSSQAIHNLLNGVRETRNDLAHFHGEISANQRDQLHFCAEWLERHRTKVLESFGVSATESEILSVPVQKDINIRLNLADEAPSQNEEASTTEEITPPDEVLSPDDSRYALLAVWLLQRPVDQEKVQLTFEIIEEIIHDKLPSSARKHRAWWSNHLEFSPQARQWWDAGWRVSTVNMNQETVVFSRIEGRQKAYIDFFSSLLAQLSRENPFPMRNPSPDGEGWVIIAGIPTNGTNVGYLGFSFARKKRFRIDMYIDMGKDKELENKAFFQKLRDRKELIEAELGTFASWEYLEGARGSRIALYHEGAITDTEEELGSLRNWAVDTMILFQKVMDKNVSELA